MKKLFIPVLLLYMFCGYLPLLGQSEPVFSQYMYDRMLINPAYAGSSSWIVGSLKYRNHMHGFDGAPTTSLFTAHAPLQKKSMGLGIKASYEQVAVSQTMAFSGIYSFHIGFGKGKLSFGLEGGLVQRKTDFNSLVRYDPDDPSIPMNMEAAMAPEAAVGIYYHSQNYYFGVSAYHLFDSKKKVPDYERNNMFSLTRSYYGLAGYIFDIDETYYIEPGVVVRYVEGAPLQTDFFLNLSFKERITLGGGYRMWDVATVMLKVNVTSGLHVAYSYDLNLSELSDYSSGSHEIMLSYGIKLLPPPAKKEVHPRYYF